MQSILILVAYVVIFGLFIYFLMVKPQKKQQAAHDQMVAALEPGDSILTTSGFYGVIIGVEDDIVIVEFGSNKNCRIPMQKSAIVEVEKANDGIEQ